MDILIKERPGAGVSSFVAYFLSTSVRYIPYIVLVVFLLALLYVKSLQLWTAGMAVRISLCDAIIYAYSSSSNVSLLWFICSALVMLILIVLWHDTENDYAVVHQRSVRQRWCIRLCEIVIVCACVSVVLHIALICWSFILLGAFCNFDASNSMFVYQMGMNFAGEFPGGWFLFITLVYSFFALFFTSTVFCLFFSFFKSAVVAFVVASLLNLGYVHGRHAIIIDLFDLISFSYDPNIVANPLYYFYSLADVGYEVWLPGGDTFLWVLPLEIVCFALLGWFLFKKQDRSCCVFR